MIRSLISISAVLLLAGCTNSVEPSYASYKGRFIYGHEVSSFEPCDQAKTYWLNGDIELMTLIQQQSLQRMKETEQPYQPIYLHFSGNVDQREAVGFAEQYDGQLYVKTLFQVSQIIPPECQ